MRRRGLWLQTWIICMLPLAAFADAPHGGAPPAPAPQEVTIELEKKIPRPETPRNAADKKRPPGKAKRQPREPATADSGGLEDPFANPQAVREKDDPWEGYNRFMSGVNGSIEKYLFSPLARGYRFIVPEDARVAIRNVLTNAAMPAQLVSSLAQGDWQKSSTVVNRFLVNSTLGLGGMFDVAEKHFGMKPVREDFDQALGKRGVPEGPFVVLPVLGPSTARHATGRAVDSLLNPATYFAPFLITGGVAAGGQFNNYSLYMDDKKLLDEDALDSYQSLKHFYFENREKLLNE